MKSVNKTTYGDLVDSHTNCPDCAKPTPMEPIKSLGAMLYYCKVCKITVKIWMNKPTKKELEVIVS